MKVSNTVYLGDNYNSTIKAEALAGWASTKREEKAFATVSEEGKKQYYHNSGSAGARSEALSSAPFLTSSTTGTAALLITASTFEMCQDFQWTKGCFGNRQGWWRRLKLRLFLPKVERKKSKICEIAIQWKHSQFLNIWLTSGDESSWDHLPLYK